MQCNATDIAMDDDDDDDAPEGNNLVLSATRLFFSK
jgi:hypothetical protein